MWYNFVGFFKWWVGVGGGWSVYFPSGVSLYKCDTSTLLFIFAKKSFGHPSKIWIFSFPFWTHVLMKETITNICSDNRVIFSYWGNFLFFYIFPLVHLWAYSVERFWWGKTKAKDWGEKINRYFPKTEITFYTKV